MNIDPHDRDEITQHLCVCLEKLITDHDQRHVFLDGMWNVAEAMITEWRTTNRDPDSETPMYFGTPKWAKLVAPLSDAHHLRVVQTIEVLIRAVSYWSAIRGGREAEADIMMASLLN